MPKPEDRPVAALTVRDAAQMTPEGLREVADWLRSQAAFIEEYGPKIGSSFQATYRIQ